MQSLEIDLRLECSVEIAHRCEPALVCERAHALGEHRAADGVDDQVYAFTAGRLHGHVMKTDTTRLDADVEPETLELRELVRGTRRADNVPAERLCGLQRRDADARRGARDQQPFVLLKMSVRHEHVVRHHEHERDCSCLLPR